MGVAYDSAVAAGRVTATDTLNYAFTNTGGNAIFVGAGCEWFGPTVSTLTYAGAALTSLWNVNFATFFGNAGFYKAGPATGLNNVIVTMTAAVDVLTSGAISFTGVDQTTPVGTHVVATGASTAVTVTVASVGTDDMVVDCFSRGQGASSIPVGADQTQRFSSGAVTESGSLGSTQPGTAGGVMSWAPASSVDWHIGAVAFKPSISAVVNRIVDSRLRPRPFAPGIHR